jgi:hypothetical protein
MSIKLALAIEGKYNKVKQTPIGELIIQLKSEELSRVLSTVSAYFQSACNDVDDSLSSTYQTNSLREEMIYLGEIYSFTVIVYMRNLVDNLKS